MVAPQVRSVRMLELFFVLEYILQKIPFSGHNKLQSGTSESATNTFSQCKCTKEESLLTIGRTVRSTSEAKCRQLSVVISFEVGRPPIASDRLIVARALHGHGLTCKLTKKRCAKVQAPTCVPTCVKTQPWYRISQRILPHLATNRHSLVISYRTPARYLQIPAQE